MIKITYAKNKMTITHPTGVVQVLTKIDLEKLRQYEVIQMNSVVENITNYDNCIAKVL